MRGHIKIGGQMVEIEVRDLICLGCKHFDVKTYEKEITEEGRDYSMNACKSTGVVWADGSLIACSRFEERWSRKMATKKELKKKIESLESWIKALTNPNWELQKEGNPEHAHKVFGYELKSVSGIVFCSYTCECGREVSHVVGERLNPKDSGMW